MGVVIEVDGYVWFYGLGNYFKGLSILGFVQEKVWVFDGVDRI